MNESGNIIQGIILRFKVSLFIFTDPTIFFNASKFDVIYKAVKKRPIEKGIFIFPWQLANIINTILHEVKDEQETTSKQIL